MARIFIHILKALTVVLPATMGLPAWAVDRAEVLRLDPARLTLRWQDADPVDIYVADAPHAPLSGARLVSRANRTGQLEIKVSDTLRRYYLLRDGGDGSWLRVAERVLPLERGSNFRDLGGYPAAAGKRVKWGKIFRTGATPLLTDHDYSLLSGLGIRSVIDFRSLDEREIAPSQLGRRLGALFLSSDYGARTLMKNMPHGVDGRYPSDMYRDFPTFFIPQYRALFDRLMAADGSVLFNCSAGQDRTGTAAALVLSALGVPRDVILQDYQLSTPSRRPQVELPEFDPAQYPQNPIAQYYAAATKMPGGIKAEPLYGTDGVSYLQRFFEVIDHRWGSVDAYLEKELGIDVVDRATLRQLYLET